jgi:hypothetical protein
MENVSLICDILLLPILVKFVGDLSTGFELFGLLVAGKTYSVK